jgi:hypothetical protein
MLAGSYPRRFHRLRFQHYLSTCLHNGSSEYLQFFSYKGLLSRQATTTDDSGCLSSDLKEEGGVVGIEDIGEGRTIDQQHLFCVFVGE